MKTIYSIVNKVYDKNLVDYKDIKKQYRRICSFLEEYGFSEFGKQDDDVIQYEIFYNSLQIKRQFEDVFFDTYVKMYDYWYDLTYQERKQQMNVDIKYLTETLTHFEEDGEDIYMPSFAPWLNHLYHTEIVLLDLKQYHRFIRDCAKEMERYRYGAKVFQYGFSNLMLLAEQENGYIVYHDQAHRFYHYTKDGLVKTLSLDPKKEIEDECKTMIAMYMLKDEEDHLVAALKEHQLVKKRVIKKLEKLLYKKKKREEKRINKE